MPRRNRRLREPERRRGGGTDAGTVEGPNGRFQFRRVNGAAAEKTYRCPGCDLEIRPGTPHVVAWADGGDGDDRRHWHTGCWNARDRRRPGRFR
ncbi:MAG TPA: ATP/GTP-binding protein [Thermobifida alba]|nr:ATP/GTP-binding protein [Thermobifida alba]